VHGHAQDEEAALLAELERINKERAAKVARSSVYTILASSRARMRAG
jgi:hypothetical protein